MEHQNDLDLKDMDVFHFDEDYENFNSLARSNGFTHWYARQYMRMLGYENYKTFFNAINKAMTTCMTLHISVAKEFEQIEREIDGKVCEDYKLSRFACYLVAMNADVKKTKVAQAQAFFAASAETIRRYVDNREDIERVQIRDEISTHEKSLSDTAHNAGVSGSGFAFFQNAGYRGLYNMDINELKSHKGMPGSKKSLLDFMGSTELAANLFRITQTNEKIKNEGITGQRKAEAAAETVGRKVRKTMLDISGQKPEDLSLAEDISKVKTSLKQTHKGLNKLDG